MRRGSAQPTVESRFSLAVPNIRGHSAKRAGSSGGGLRPGHAAVPAAADAQVQRPPGPLRADISSRPATTFPQSPACDRQRRLLIETGREVPGPPRFSPFRPAERRGGPEVRWTPAQVCSLPHRDAGGSARLRRPAKSAEQQFQRTAGVHVRSWSTGTEVPFRAVPSAVSLPGSERQGHQELHRQGGQGRGERGDPPQHLAADPVAAPRFGTGLADGGGRRPQLLRSPAVA